MTTTGQAGHSKKRALAILVAAGLATSASGQPLSTPTAGPNPAPARRVPPPAAPGPDLATAWRAARAAIHACRPEPVAVAVLDSAGADKLIVVADGGRLADFARRKAFTALTFARPSMATRDAARSDPDLARRLATEPRLIAFGGGLPILRSGQPFGAIAVAGGSSQELDQGCAAAGLARMR